MEQLPRLEEDMRKLPSSTKGVNGRNPHKSVSQEQANSRKTSISAPSSFRGHSSGGFSPVQGESSATSVPDQLAMPTPSSFKKKKKTIPKKRRLPTKKLKGPSSPEQRYWNEFDDGSEGERDEPYTIFVDPNPSSTFPGVATVSKILENLSANSKMSWSKVQTWLTPKPKGYANPNERSSLIDDNSSPISPTIDDSSDSDIESGATVKRQDYSAMAYHRRRHSNRSVHESVLFRCSLGSFLAAVAFLLVAAIVGATGRREAAAEVNVGVVVCVAASLVSAVVGAGCTIARYDTISWIHRSLVGLALVIVLFGNAGVLVGLGHT